MNKFKTLKLAALLSCITLTNVHAAAALTTYVQETTAIEAHEQFAASTSAAINTIAISRPADITAGHYLTFASSAVTNPTAFDYVSSSGIVSATLSYGTHVYTLASRDIRADTYTATSNGIASLYLDLIGTAKDYATSPDVLGIRITLTKAGTPTALTGPVLGAYLAGLSQSTYNLLPAAGSLPLGTVATGWTAAAAYYNAGFTANSGVVAVVPTSQAAVTLAPATGNLALSVADLTSTTATTFTSQSLKFYNMNAATYTTPFVLTDGTGGSMSFNLKPSVLGSSPYSSVDSALRTAVVGRARAGQSVLMNPLSTAVANTQHFIGATGSGTSLNADLMAWCAAAIVNNIPDSTAAYATAGTIGNNIGFTASTNFLQGFSYAPAPVASIIKFYAGLQADGTPYSSLDQTLSVSGSVIALNGCWSTSAIAAGVGETLHCDVNQLISRSNPVMTASNGVVLTNDAAGLPVFANGTFPATTPALGALLFTNPTNDRGILVGITFGTPVTLNAIGAIYTAAEQAALDIANFLGTPVTGLFPAASLPILVPNMSPKLILTGHV